VLRDSSEFTTAILIRYFLPATFSLMAMLHVTKAVCHGDVAAGFGANGAHEIPVIAVKDNSANRR
jgi:hypothetical protein